MSSIRPKLSFVHIYWIQVFFKYNFIFIQNNTLCNFGFFLFDFYTSYPTCYLSYIQGIFFKCVVWRWVLSFCVEGSISTFQYFLFVCLFTNISVTTAYKLAFHVSFFLILYSTLGLLNNFVYIAQKIKIIFWYLKN